MIMESLGKGNYLGNVNRCVFDEYLMFNITSYSGINNEREMHCHDTPHISFVLDGGSVEKRKNSEKERLPGTITYYHAGEFHQSAIIANPSTHINLELYDDFFSDGYIEQTTFAGAVTNNPDNKFLLLKTLNETAANDGLSALSIRMILMEIADNAVRLKAKAASYPWVNKIDELLRSDLYAPPSLNQLSVMLGLHPVTISRQFHHYYGCTLGDYVRKLRVEKALTLIKDREHSLTEIAFACGFADQSHFIRAFKRFTGLLPLAYQKNRGC